MHPTHEGSNRDDHPGGPLSRRRFVQTIGTTAVAASALPRVIRAEEQVAKKSKPESLVAKLYETLSPEQKKTVWFPWDHETDDGPYRQHVDNNWQITKPTIASDFYTSEQQDLIEAIFWGMYDEDWRDRIKKQLRDDAGGYGKRQSIAIFGEPGTGKFQFAMTGRHLTIRCDGDSAENVAFGGPIFYGHAAQGFNEKPDHPGNVFWPQAQKANALYQMLDGKQREQALVKSAPFEWDVSFEGGGGKFDGIAVGDLSQDQKEHVKSVLQSLLEPYRQSDREEAVRCLDQQGGLEACRLAFYREGDIGDDGVWDVWRLEGPAFVWHYRGAPHVHVWANVAGDPSVKVNAG